MTEAILAHGAKILIGDGADPEVFATIGNLGDFDYNKSQELVDTTNHSSGGYKEFIADLIEGEDVSFPVNFLRSDATHTALESKLGDKVNFRFEFPGDTDGEEVAGIITAVGKSAPVSGAVLSMSVTIKPTGVPTTYTIA